MSEFLVVLIFGGVSVLERERKMGSYSEKLRTLCLNTGWKYAVFWKFKYRARMSVLSFFFLILIFFFFFPSSISICCLFG